MERFSVSSLFFHVILRELNFSYMFLNYDFRLELLLTLTSFNLNLSLVILQK